MSGKSRTSIQTGSTPLQSWFLCHEFNGEGADVRLWWELADNFEGETISIMALYQVPYPDTVPSPCQIRIFAGVLCALCELLECGAPCCLVCC